MPVIRSAKVVILDANGSALLLVRSDSHPTSPLCSDLPGGVIEESESPEDGLIREINEETGMALAPSDLSLVYTATNDYFGQSVSRSLFLVRLSTVQPQVKLSWEHSDYQWVKTSQLVELERPYQEGVDYAIQHKLMV